MRVANSLLIALALAPLAACHKSQPADQNIAVSNQTVDMNGTMADIETLPPDESSTTPTNQLENGFDNPDVNDLGNAGNSQ
ncbi:MAG TPA: hypothetical protein VFW39_03780 [Sphingomicrobium sp.]|nr:hypothetical protein [Sphingomicrobium sp.]